MQKPPRIQAGFITFKKEQKLGTPRKTGFINSQLEQPETKKLTTQRVSTPRIVNKVSNNRKVSSLMYKHSINN